MTQSFKSSKREKCSAFIFAAILSLGTQVLAQEIPGTSPEPHPFEIWGAPGKGRQFASDDEYAEYCNGLVSHLTGPYALNPYGGPGTSGDLLEVYVLAGCKTKGMVSEYQLQKHRKAEADIRQSVIDGVSCSTLKSDLDAHDNSWWLEEHYHILQNCQINDEQASAYRELHDMQPGWFTADFCGPTAEMGLVHSIPGEYWFPEESDCHFEISGGEMVGPVWEERLEQLNKHCNRPLENSEPAFGYEIENEPWFRDIPKPADCRL